jgi:hypothetical protein
MLGNGREKSRDALAQSPELQSTMRRPERAGESGGPKSLATHAPFRNLLGMSRDDFAALSDVLLEHAKRAIIDDGALFPIGATVTASGEVVPLIRMNPFDEGKDDVRSVVEEILRAFRTLADEKRARAVAWCVDMRVVPPGGQDMTDALMLFCESVDGTAPVVMNPYADAPGPETKFVGRHVLSTEPRVFGTPA